MTSRKLRVGAVVSAIAALGTLSACTSDNTLGRASGPVVQYRLLAFNSCADALAQLRAASRQAVGPYGFNQPYGFDQKALGPAIPLPQAAVPGAATDNTGGRAEAPAGAPPAYSDTNNQEVGIEEPDLVKTDGRRIIVVHNGTLLVIDAASRDITGSVSLADPAVPNDPVRYGAADLLLSGDHALVLVSGAYPMATGGGVAPAPPMVGGGQAPAVPGGIVDDKSAAVPTVPTTIYGPRLLLVDLAGEPRVLSRLSVDGSLLDARQTGSIARVVVSSTPRITFPDVPNSNTSQRTRVNQSIVDQAGIDTWLPRIDVTTGSSTAHVKIGCDAVSRPRIYSGANMLTVLSLDLRANDLADPQPVSVVADGQTVYSDGDNLYVATDLRWRATPPSTSDRGTTIYQFDTSKPGRPTFVGGGTVPGYLVNQYAMSARDGYLRVATTSGNSNWESNVAVTSQSGVYVLHRNGDRLVQVGKVEGLGRGEKIYAVRFLDSTAYVVTFKQTDPLYTVDLSNPAKPTVHGALKISGYSSYLHPIGDGRLIGIGQDVNDHLQTQGTQLSLFDVSNLDNPTRLDVYHLSGMNSEAEFDPHAFLYWPATGLLVIPVNAGYLGPTVYSAPAQALALRVNGDHFSPIGGLAQPAVADAPSYPIRRTLVIGSTLWTVSDRGLMASDLSTLQTTGWIPLG